MAISRNYGWNKSWLKEEDINEARDYKGSPIVIIDYVGTVDLKWLKIVLDHWPSIVITAKKRLEKSPDS